jgi:hypothetical protein
MATKQSTRTSTKRDPSPDWTGYEEWNENVFGRFFHRSMEWYRLESSTKELKPKIINWMALNGYDTKAVAAFKKTKDNRCNLTMGGIAANLLRGMPESYAGFNNGRNTADWLREAIANVVAEGRDDVEAEPTEVKIKTPVNPITNIQDRIREQAGEMSEELDYAIDRWIMDPEAFNPKDIKVVNLLKGKGVKAAQARYIKLIFKGGLDELLELSSGEADEQLREAYKHNSRKNVKKLIEFYESIMAACDQIAAEAKVLKKPRKAKIKPAEELVKKLKFMLSDTKLGITSVPPAGIIGAQGAVVYNTKTRKIGLYISKTSDGLGVKGTSITEFTDKSFQRTLRKPLEQIKEFKDQNTQKRVETWFTKIKTTETLLNGRMNEDVVLLKVFK